jgi:hypothetical protein
MAVWDCCCLAAGASPGFETFIASPSLERKAWVEIHKTTGAIFSSQL